MRWRGLVLGRRDPARGLFVGQCRQVLDHRHEFADEVEVVEQLFATARWCGGGPRASTSRWPPCPARSSVSAGEVAAVEAVRGRGPPSQMASMFCGTVTVLQALTTRHSAATRTLARRCSGIAASGLRDGVASFLLMGVSGSCGSCPRRLPVARGRLICVLLGRGLAAALSPPAGSLSDCVAGSCGGHRRGGIGVRRDLSYRGRAARTSSRRSRRLTSSASSACSSCARSNASISSCSSAEPSRTRRAR